METSSTNRLAITLSLAVAALAAGAAEAASLSDLPVTTNIHMWYEAGTGVDLATGVSRWANIADDDPAAGDNKDLRQATAAKQPQLIPSGLNGLPMVRFDGVQAATQADQLDTAATGLMANLSGFDVFLVAKLDPTQDDYARVLSEEQGGAGNRLYNLGVDAASPRRVRAVMDMTGGLANLIEPTSSLGPWRVYTQRLSPGSGGTLALDVDGTEVASLSSLGSTRSSVGSIFRMGAAVSAQGRDVGKAEVAELVVYNSSLSAADRDAMVSYLQQKYDLIPPPADPQIAAIAGKKLWLDAETIRDADGAPVAFWQDCSGLGNDVTQPTAARRPTLHLGQLNGHPVVRFDGADDSLATTTTAMMEGLSGFDVFVVANLDQAQDDYGRLLSEENSGGGNRVYNLGVDASTPRRLRTVMDMTGGLAVVAEPSTSLGDFRIYGQRLAPGGGGTLSLHVNGVQVGAAAGKGSTITGRNSIFRVGAVAHNPTGDPGKGDVAEVIIFDHSLSVGERNTVGYQLEQKYGLKTAFNRPDILALGGVKLWLDAESIAGADGSPVSAWGDSSGLGNDVRQATAARQPTLQLGELNGRPIVRFDGTNDFLGTATTALMEGASQFDVFLVAKIHDNLDYARVLSEEKSGAGNRVYNLGLDAGAGARRVRSVMDMTNGMAVLTELSSSLEEFHLYRHSLAGGVMTLDVDLNEVARLLNVGATQTGQNSVFGLGSVAHTPGSLASSFDIAELLVFDRQLSAADRRFVQEYFSEKYGVPALAIIPEPATVTLFGMALGAMLPVLRRRRCR